MNDSGLDRLARGWRAYALVALLALFAAVAGVWRAPTLDRDEGRFAQASAQMLESGDFVRIRYLDEERNRKPVGIYWAQAASVALFSTVEAREIWAYRLPSVLAAILAALGTLWGGRALIGPRAAFVGASMLAASPLLAAEGMIAKTDAALCAATALCLGALARLRMREASDGGGGYALLAWAGLGLGALIKGPVTPFVAAACLLALLAMERDVRWARPLLRPWGPLLAALIVLPWLIAITLATDGRFLAEAALGDLAPKFSASGEHPFVPPGLHTLLLPVLLFPASLALPAAVGLAWRAARARSGEGAGLRFALAWALPTFVAFELLPTKLAHYPLPAYPAIALLAGAGLCALWDRGWTPRALGLVAMGLGGAGLIALCVAAAPHGPYPISVVIASGAGGLAIAALTAGLARGPAVALAALLAFSLAFSWALKDRLLPAATALFPGHAMIARLDAVGINPRSERLVHLIGFAEPSLVFRIGAHARPGIGAAAAQGAEVGDLVILTPTAREAFEAGLAARGLVLSPLAQPVEGIHYNGGGDPVTLQAARIVSAPGGATAP